MKKSFFILAFCIAGLSALQAQQVLLRGVGQKIYINSVHVFNVTMITYGGEAIVLSTDGATLLGFIPFKVPDGWVSSSSNSSTYGYNQRSGTSFTHFFRVADGNGNFCDVPSAGLRNIRDISQFVLANNLVKNNAVDQDAFDRFCKMHGKVYPALKNFE